MLTIAPDVDINSKSGTSKSGDDMEKGPEKETLRVVGDLAGSHGRVVEDLAGSHGRVVEDLGGSHGRVVEDLGGSHGRVVEDLGGMRHGGGGGGRVDKGLEGGVPGGPGRRGGSGNSV